MVVVVTKVNVKGKRSKIRTFDKAVIGCPVAGNRGRRFTGSRETPRVNWAVTSHFTSHLLQATPGDQTGR